MSLRVLVTDAGRGSGLAILRSLGRQGHRVIAADVHARSPSFRSRFAAGRVVYPPPEETADGALDELEAAVIRHGIDLLVPVTDDIILPLTTARPRFEQLCRVALPDADALTMTLDKLATADLAANVGVPAPRTQLVRSGAEAVAAADDLGWPVVVKPRFSRTLAGGRVHHHSVSYADDAPSLVRTVDALGARCDVLLSAYTRGVEGGVELLTADGRPVLAFQHRRLHHLPITGGTSTLRESVPLDPVMYGYAVALLKALHWTGLAMVEFRAGEDGPRLIEINGRAWGSLPLAVRAGVDFPARLVDVFCGRATSAAPPGPYSVGVRSRDLELELRWIAAVLRAPRQHDHDTPRRREALVAAVRLLAPRDGYDIVARDDLQPAAAEIGRLARALVGIAASKVRW